MGEDDKLRPVYLDGRGAPDGPGRLPRAFRHPLTAAIAWLRGLVGKDVAER